MGILKLSNKFVYKIFLSSLLIAAIFILLRIAPILSNSEFVPSDDFVPYWASGKLNFQGENPYDPQNIEQLQISEIGVSSGNYPITIMLNPPWTISFLMPFGMLNYYSGRLFWLIFSIALILVSTHLLWIIYSGDPKKRWIPILVIITFAPVISVLEVGQIAPWILLGLTGFLFFTTSHKNDWLAGVFIAITSIKPQIALLFWIALLIWVIQERRWLVLISASITVLVLTLITMAFNPLILQQYLAMFQAYHITDWANPTIGAYLRYFIFGIDKFWLQFVPSIIGGIWLIYYWISHNKSWNWLYDLPIILLVSQITSPYTWTYDLVILLLPIIQAALWILKDPKRRPIIIFLIIYLALNILDLVLHMRLEDFWFLWFAPSLLIWYLLVRRQYTLHPVDSRFSNQITG